MGDMGSITMCINVMCPLRDDCYRFVYEVHRGQSHEIFRPVDTVDGIECEWFLPCHREEISNDYWRDNED